MRSAVVSLSLALLFVSTAYLAQAESYRMAGSSLVPAASGVVSTDTDRNGNTKIHVDVSNLAQPHSLAPARNTYVVWVQPRGQAPINQGELKVNNELNGSFRTSVPYRIFDVFVTPEDNPRAQAPTGPELLKASVEQK
jgi:hypothetical protein